MGEKASRPEIKSHRYHRAEQIRVSKVTEEPLLVFPRQMDE